MPTTWTHLCIKKPLSKSSRLYGSLYNILEMVKSENREYRVKDWKGRNWYGFEY